MKIIMFWSCLTIQSQCHIICSQGSGEKTTNYREVRFRQFASVEYDNNIYMTPQDFLESVTEESPRRKSFWFSLFELFSATYKRLFSSSSIDCPVVQLFFIQIWFYYLDFITIASLKNSYFLHTLLLLTNEYRSVGEGGVLI